MRHVFNMISVLFLSFTTLQGQTGEHNKLDDQGRKQGVWKKYHAPDTLRYKGQFKDNRPVGTFYYYYRNSNLQSKLVFEKGTGEDTVARAKIYFPTGELMATGKYVNREKDETWKYFDYDSNLVSIESYLNGKRYGKWKVFYDDGQVAEIKHYENDLEQGEWKQFHPNGEIKVKATYEDGALEGMAEYYNTEGKLISEGPFFHGVRHGTWKFYNDDGEVAKTEEYKNGEKVGGDEDVIIRESQYEQFRKKDRLDEQDMLKRRKQKP